MPRNREEADLFFCSVTPLQNVRNENLGSSMNLGSARISWVTMVPSAPLFRSWRPPEAEWRQPARGEGTSASCFELEALVYYKLPLIFEPQPEGGYTVISPLLPDLLTEGDSVADALENVRDALAAVLEIY